MVQPAKSHRSAPPEPAANRRSRLVILLAAAGIIAGLAWWLRASNTAAPASSAPASAPSQDIERKPQSSDVPPAGADEPVAQRSSETEQFVARLLETEVRSDLAGMDVDDATVALLGRGHIAEAAGELERRAAGGDASANVVLSVLQDCSGIASDALQQMQTNEWRNAARDLPAERRSRIELALEARRQGAETATKSCNAATFDRGAIAERLRAAGAAGHEASLRRLGEETTDAQARLKLWTSAAMLGHVPAQLDLAQHYRRDFLGSQRSGGRMKFWLDVAAKYSSAGKLLLAECHLNGCNGQPPDPETGNRLLHEAAAAGDLEAIEKLTGAADSGEVAIEARIAWFDFRDRLNEAGCYGASEYPRVSIASWRIREENRAVSPYLQQQEQALADQYWREHGATARRLLDCD